MSKARDTKPHIGIFGRRNNGKSSLINALTGQDIAIVSTLPGTTTDPVKKSIEIFGIGPAIVIDTAGMDDSGSLGEKRIAKSKEMFKVVDMAILVISANKFGDPEKELISEFNDHNLPFLIVHNKSDLAPLDASLAKVLRNTYSTQVVDFCATSPENMGMLIEFIGETIPESSYVKRTLVGDLISPKEVVLLITPIDSEAPEGRMILPQMQVIRDVLDHNGICAVIKEHEVADYIQQMEPKPVLVITDSQVFPKADAAVPKEIMLTSFSIVLARQKGNFRQYMEGVSKISELKTGDRVLILESCTHQISCDDIGRRKIPGWLDKFVGTCLDYDVVAGLSKVSRPITDYAIVIQCGGCMITRKQVQQRLQDAIDAGIPVTNYGMAIAYVHGIYDRAIQPFLAHK